MKSIYQIVKNTVIFLITISVPALFLLSGGFSDTDLGFFALPWYVNFGAVMIYALPVIVPIAELLFVIDRFITKKSDTDKHKKLNRIALVASILDLTVYIFFFTLYPSTFSDDTIVMGIFTVIAAVMSVIWITLLILRYISKKENLLLFIKILNTATPLLLALVVILYIQNLFVFRSAILAVLIYCVLTILTIWIIKLCKYRNEVKTPGIYHNKSFWICYAAVLFLLLCLTSR